MPAVSFDDIAPLATESAFVAVIVIEAAGFVLEEELLELEPLQPASREMDKNNAEI